MSDYTGFMPEETGADQVRVESFFKPNLALIDKVLATKQDKYNSNLDALAKAKAKIAEVNTLEGYDRNRWFELQDDYDKEVEKVLGLFDGDLSKADAELSTFTGRVGRDFGIHGEANALNERALGYMKNKQELDQRYAKGKITQGQYWKLSKELEDTKEIGIGKNSKQWNSWRKINPMDAIDFDKFANEFLKNKEKSLVQDGWTKSKDGDFYKWVNNEHKYITYESVMDELSQAYIQKAETTGQLTDDFEYNLYKNRIDITADTYINKYSDELNKFQQIQQNLNTLKGKELQQYINSLGLTNPLKEDGLVGSQTKAAREGLLDYAAKNMQKYQGEVDRITEMKDDQDRLRNVYYQDYIWTEARRLSHPYAGAKSMDERKQLMQLRKDPFVDVAIHAAKRKIDKEMEAVQPIINASPPETITPDD